MGAQGQGSRHPDHQMRGCGRRQDPPPPGPADARLQDQIPSALQSPEAGRRPCRGQQTQDLLPVTCPDRDCCCVIFWSPCNLREIKLIHTSKKKKKKKKKSTCVDTTA